MTSVPRLLALIDATRYIVRNGIAGDMVECGVWRGGSMMMAAKSLLHFEDVHKKLYLFDTFEGMPAPTEDITNRAPSKSATDIGSGVRNDSCRTSSTCRSGWSTGAAVSAPSLSRAGS